MRAEQQLTRPPGESTSARHDCEDPPPHATARHSSASQSPVTIAIFGITDLQIAFEDRVLAVSSAVADRWAELMVPDPVSVIDGLLAATALVHDSRL